MVEQPEANQPQPDTWKNPGVSHPPTQKSSTQKRRDRFGDCCKRAYCRFQEALPSADHSIAIATWVLALITVYALFAAETALHKSQRPWVVSEKIETLAPFEHSNIYCRVGYKVFIRNTGNSIARSLTFDSRAVKFPPTLDWLAVRVEDLSGRIIKLWSNKRPEGLPFGITLAPSQLISPVRCPAFSDGNDPTDEQVKMGAFLVIGYMQYTDQFGLPHHTRFAFTPDGDSVRPWDGKTYVIYNDYQDAD